MSSQLDLFSSQGEAAKESGQKRALSALDPSYSYDFDMCIKSLISKGFPFTIDDVIERIGLPSSGQNKNNSVGGLMSRAAKEKKIRKLGYTVSRRPENHGRIITQWIGV